MTRLIDGSLSTLAPIFAVALATHRPQYAFFAGLATAIGAGVSMAFSEGLSDTGELTGRGSAYLRGSNRRRHLPGRNPAYTAVPDPAVPHCADRRDRGDRLRALDTLLDPRALLRHRVSPLVRVGRTRGRDHRRRQRRARRGSGLTTQAAKTMSTLGFVGLGRMGGNMAARFLRAGYTVYGEERSREHAQALVDEGLRWRDTPREVAETVDVIFTSLPDDAALELVASGPDGILAGSTAGKIWVDMSTVSPRASRKVAE